MKKFYAVAVGRVPGIYMDWDITKDQIHKFGGAKFKSFITQSEAEIWMQAHRAAFEPRILPDNSVLIQIHSHEGNLFDMCGFSAILKYQGNEKIIRRRYKVSTKIRLELLACIESLRLLKKKHSRVIVHCSCLVGNTPALLGLLDDMRCNKWLNNGQMIENADLWQPLSYLIEKHNVEFKHSNSNMHGVSFEEGKISRDLIHEILKPKPKEHVAGRLAA